MFVIFLIAMLRSSLKVPPKKYYAGQAFSSPTPLIFRLDCVNKGRRRPSGQILRVEGEAWLDERKIFLSLLREEQLVDWEKRKRLRERPKEFWREMLNWRNWSSYRIMKVAFTCGDYHRLWEEASPAYIWRMESMEVANLTLCNPR